VVLNLFVKNSYLLNTVLGGTLYLLWMNDQENISFAVQIHSNSMPGEAPPSGFVYVDASLLHCLQPTEPVDNGYRVLSSQKGGKENLSKCIELSS